MIEVNEMPFSQNNKESKALCQEKQYVCFPGGTSYEVKHGLILSSPFKPSLGVSFVVSTGLPVTLFCNCMFLEMLWNTSQKHFVRLPTYHHLKVACSTLALTLYSRSKSLSATQSTTQFCCIYSTITGVFLKGYSMPCYGGIVIRIIIFLSSSFSLSYELQHSFLQLRSFFHQHKS